MTSILYTKDEWNLNKLNKPTACEVLEGTRVKLSKSSGALASAVVDMTHSDQLVGGWE